MSQFHVLAIKEVRRESPDCVSIAFDVPEHLAKSFQFEAGQNITLRLNSEGQELRRSYSICSSPAENELRVAVKKIGGGKFSELANDRLKAGDRLEVLLPSGKFSTKLDAAHAKHYLAFAAGSGITPIISIIKTVLTTELFSRFTLVYGNRNRTSIIFREQLEGLKNRHMQRFVLHHILSREKTDSSINHGRIDAEKCSRLAEKLIDFTSIDEFFLCGPEAMIFDIRNWLLARSVAPGKIHFELFTVPGQNIAVAATEEDLHSDQKSKVTIRLDGITLEFNHPFSGQAILDGALAQGADLPFACKGGVCATCKAKLVSGEVIMDNNYALEAAELAEGFILTCQSHPRSAEIMIDFDQR